MACQGINSKGEPCQAPDSVVNSEGFCPAHRPDGHRDMMERAKRGGAAKARRERRKDGLAPEELPPLDSHADAETWLEVIGRAAATGRVGHNEAKAGISAVRQWLRAREKGAVAEKLEDLQDALEEARETGDFAPVLEVVK